MAGGARPGKGGESPGLVEGAGEAVHGTWMAERVRQGTPAHTLEDCPLWAEPDVGGDCTNPKPSAHHFNMVPWVELPEDAKEIDRVTARAVMATLDREAPRP